MTLLITDITKPDEFKRAFDHYFESIRNFVYFKTGDMQLAEDICQDTFVKLWEKREDVKVATLKNYLYTIAGNLTNNHFNKQKTFLKFEFRSKKESFVENPMFLMEYKEFDDKLKSALAALPEKKRTVFLMSRIEELSYKEIASRLDVSVKAVEKRMSEALKHLRTVLQVSL